MLKPSLHVRLLGASIALVTAGTSLSALADHPATSVTSALLPIESVEAPALSGSAVRNRLIEIDIATISPLASARSVVEFGLFDDVVFQAARQQVNVLGEGRWSWVGALVDEPQGVAQFAVRDGVVSGIIRSPKRGVFRVRYAGEAGVYIAEEIDTANLETCATGAAQSVAEPGDVAAIGSVTARGGTSTIDVLIGYTAAARSEAGGTAGMLAEIDLAVASANLAYQNSEVDIDLVLVHAMYIAYSETGNASTDLTNWRFDGDGSMDEVHDDRDDIAADMCALLVSSLNACGIGNLMTVPSTAFQNRAFTVTELGCAVNNLSFAHELGHNLGCAHDHDNASTGAYSYSFGYRDPSAPANWRTVMAYAPGVRIPYFSNPDVTYFGQPTGISTGTSPANNALSLNQTRTIAELWRDASTRQPVQFDLDSPSNGLSSVWGDFEFTWESAGLVEMYSLIIATDAGLNNVVYQADGLTGNSFTLPVGVLAGCTTFYWGIEATLNGNTRSATPVSRVFSTRLGGDINLDGVVDTADLGGLVGSFGGTGNFGDINGDGIVDTADLGALIGEFGQSCSP